MIIALLLSPGRVREFWSTVDGWIGVVAPIGRAWLQAVLKRKRG